MWKWRWKISNFFYSVSGSSSSWVTTVQNVTFINLMKWRYNNFILSHDIKCSHDQMDMSFSRREPFNLSLHCGLLQKEMWHNYFVTWNYVIKRDMWLGKWEPINLSHHCTKFGAWKSYENGDNVFILSSDIPLQHVQRDIWYGKWEPLTQNQCPARFGGCWFCGNRDMAFWIYNST